jgi:hypothetical protein
MEAKHITSSTKGPRVAQVWRLQPDTGEDVYFVILSDKETRTVRHLFCQNTGLEALRQGAEWAIKFVEKAAL